jgi:hypothetical protein
MQRRGVVNSSGLRRAELGVRGGCKKNYSSESGQETGSRIAANGE